MFVQEFLCARKPVDEVREEGEGMSVQKIRAHPDCSVPSVVRGEEQKLRGELRPRPENWDHAPRTATTPRPGLPTRFYKTLVSDGEVFQWYADHFGIKDYRDVYALLWIVIPIDRKPRKGHLPLLPSIAFVPYYGNPKQYLRLRARQHQKSLVETFPLLQPLLHKGRALK